MSLAAKVIGLAGVALLLLTLAGLLVRRRWSQWYAFTLYLPVVSAFTLAFLSRPGLWTWDAWFVQENVLNALRFAVALELAAHGGHCGFIRGASLDGYAEGWIAERLSAGLSEKGSE